MLLLTPYVKDRKNYTPEIWRIFTQFFRVNISCIGRNQTFRYILFIIYIFLLHNPIYFIHCTITSWLQATLSRVVRGDSGGLNWGRNAFMRCTSMIPIRFFALARVKRARGQMLRSAPACCLAHIPSSCVGRCFSRTSPVPPETIGIVIQSFFRSKH